MRVYEIFSWRIELFIFITLKETDINIKYSYWVIKSLYFRYDHGLIHSVGSSGKGRPRQQLFSKIGWSPLYKRYESSLITVNSIAVPSIWYSKTILLNIMEVLKELFCICLLTSLFCYSRYGYMFLSIKKKGLI